MKALLLALALAAPRGAPPAPPRLERPAAHGAYPAEVDVERLAADDLRAMADGWRLDPVLFVHQHFKVDPDDWQKDTLRALLTSPRTAMSACKGPGKSTTLSWAGWWILTCHEDSQGAALSITQDNLRDGLWKELAVWYHRSPLLPVMFELQKQRIVSRERPDVWFLSARSFAQDADPGKQANTLAGLHAPVIFVLLDEVGDMPAGVVAAAKGIFAVRGQRGWILAAGNPTTQNGALYWITTTDAAQWRVVYITGDPDDPKRSPRIDIEWARAEIAALGRDNPWVMVNVLGLFPPQGMRQLISANDVTLAMARDLPYLHYSADARVWGLDPARSERAGADEAALARRQGVLFRKVLTWRGLDGVQLAAQVARLFDQAERDGEPPDAIFVDVGGIGASAYDQLRLLGFAEIVHGIDFGGAADDPKYADKRTEMWVELAEDLRRKPMCLPNDPVLRAELVAPLYDFKTRNRRTCFVLESKDDMKKLRGLRSPNRADACALTKAAPVAPGAYRQRSIDAGRMGKVKIDYDPLARRA